MSKRVNFNKANSNSKKIKNLSYKQIIAILIISIILIVILVSVTKRYNKEFNNIEASNNSLPYNISSSSLDDVLKSYSVKLLNYTDTLEKLTMYVEFDRNLFDGEKSNQKFFSDLCDVIAEYVDYKNFEFIDNKKDIDISIKCDKPYIVEFIVNGDNNYFLNKQTEINLKKFQVSTTNFSIQSQELQSLINNNWKENDIDFGTRESTIDGYNVYFDEGFLYKNVAIRVFNIIFTTNYKSKIAGGLGVGATPAEVVSALGEPTFADGDNVYGYKGELNYLFFDFVNNQVSCYPVKNLLEQNENDLITYINQMNETGNIKEFATNITTMWIDYDTYDFDSNYVDLKYTLRGINLNISGNSLENGLFIYQNYQGDKSITDLDNVYLKDTDSVFEYEKKRSSSERISRVDQGDFSEEYFEKYLGNDYSVKFSRYEGDMRIGPRFYSRDRSHPDSELGKHIEVSSYIWLNDFIFVYSIDNDGIYAYNCNDRNNQKLINLNEKIKINDFEDGKLIYNDSETLQILVEE